MKQISDSLPEKYAQGVIVIHWISALLIISLFPLGKYMADIELSDKLNLIKIHTVLGSIVFILTLIRSFLFFTKKRPPALKHRIKIQRLPCISNPSILLCTAIDNRRIGNYYSYSWRIY